MRNGYDMETAARTTVNLFALQGFEQVAAMASALARPPGEALEQQRRAEALTQAIQSRLERPDGIFIDGLKSDDSSSRHASLQSNAWALAVGVVPPDKQDAVASYVIQSKSSMGLVYYRVLLDALHGSGHDAALVALLTDPNRPGYAQILQRGATFTWESWNAPDVGDSQSHGWGSTVLAVLQEDILGVRVSAPGAAHVVVRPPASPVTRASGTVPTQRGPIPIAWTRDHDGQERIELTIPANVQATVWLAASDVRQVSLDGKPAKRARVVGSEVAIDLGSGAWVLANTPPRSPPGHGP
jgi:alpha-L-rhamnosidase